jgi:hypothetical protein
VNRKRALVCALLALAVPLPALALDGGSGGGSLDVQASLDRCGVGNGSIVCKIDASFSGLPDAEYYTASVTAPDGSVSDSGAVAEGDGGGTAALWVRYAGNGRYTVTISAWGYDERGNADIVSSADAGAEGDASVKDEGALKVVEPPDDATVEGDAEPGGTQPPEQPVDQPPECPEVQPQIDPAGGTPDTLSQDASAQPTEQPAPAPPIESPCEESEEEAPPPPPVP